MRGVSGEYFDDFYPDFQMAATVNRVPFDQNDRKYKCLCGQLHIKKGARIVAILVNVLTAINIIFSFTRSSTVFVYTCMSTAFSIVIFGSLLYGVWKEKRLYLYPYLFFQIISIAISIIILFAFLISIAVGASMVVDLARNVGNVDTTTGQEKLDAGIIFRQRITVILWIVLDLAVFTVLFILFLCIGGLIQAYFVDVIYTFHNFLKDRENSFSFNFESYSNSAFGSEATPTPPPTYPETQVVVS
ncbi:Protein CBG16844 [Caenorhabditis briggsae]|uniref:Protein CBG16844 n=1 Tax=Caenorhabditis briggsae TaxID=6238 RepID=A8XPX6_CAEBR|nr:Protein CBG16844 [Caenorhabditis briggsae]CAP34702.2 Protein CBG16844 [Caenorhabditis briggsae]